MRQDIEASVIGGLLIGGLTPTASDVLATLEPGGCRLAYCEILHRWMTRAGHVLLTA
ncbi:TPA: hypothetical protein ACGR0Y_004798 [Escherichia coli]|nr:hypothetical protein [Escherichia coli]